MMKETLKQKEIICENCGCVYHYTGRKRKYCYQVKLKHCSYSECYNYYSYKCISKRTSNYCSANCQNLYISNRPDVKTKKAKHPNKGWLDRDKYLKSMKEKYGLGVTNPSQLDSVRKQRRLEASKPQNSIKKRVKEKYGVENITQVPELLEKVRNSNKVSQKLPEVSTKRLTAAYPYLKNVEEYVKINYIEWALNFTKFNQRKPTLVDLKEYFNLKKPPKLPYEAKPYYRLKDSYLELLFENILKEEFNFKLNEDYFRRKRFLKGDAQVKHGMELDFYLPELNLAFEIQDNSTHSKTSDVESALYGQLKKGPTYSNRKIELAKDYGILLIEAWEDEFKNIEVLKRKVKRLVESSYTPEVVKYTLPKLNKELDKIVETKSEEKDE